MLESSSALTGEAARRQARDKGVEKAIGVRGQAQRGGHAPVAARAQRGGVPGAQRLPRLGRPQISHLCFSTNYEESFSDHGMLLLAVQSLRFSQCAPTRLFQQDHLSGFSDTVIQSHHCPAGIQCSTGTRLAPDIHSS